MKLGEKIFELRKKCGLSQEQLGEKINKLLFFLFFIFI